ncbi:MAG: PEP-CTERM sorting domain-containing protein [Burkholderiaceae bacterium]|jgi:hypothetical protein|nr:PEP-CTERM sorting domain-containing protein [Burkholderiaceae bacterium]
MPYRPRPHALALAATALLSATGGAQAQGAATAEWTDWTAGGGSLITGVMNTGGEAVGVTFTGASVNSFLGRPPEPYWGPASTYLGPAIAGTPPNSDIIVIAGGAGSGTFRISFSQAVQDPVFAIASLGLTNSTRSVNIQTGMFFDQPVEVLSNGPNYFAGGRFTPFIVSAGTQLFGTESSGVVRFRGSFTEISWTSPLAELNDSGDVVGTYMINVGTAGCLNHELRPLTQDSLIRAGCSAYTQGADFTQQRRLEVRGRLKSETRYVLAGELDVKAGGRVDLIEGGHVAPAGRLEVAGRLNTANPLSVAGSLKTLPGSFTTINGLAVEPLADARLRGSVSLGGALSVNGLLEVGEGGSVSAVTPLVLRGGGARLSVAGGGVLDAMGIQTFDGATVEVGGHLRSLAAFSATGTVQVLPGGRLSLLSEGSLFASVANAGTLEFMGGDVAMPGGKLDNSGRMLLAAGSFSAGAAAVFSNLGGGRIEVSGGTLKLSVGLTNQGTLQLDGGTLQLAAGTLLNTGMVQSGDGAQVLFQGGSVLNSGTMVLGGQFANAGTLTNQGQLTLRAAPGAQNTGQIVNSGTLRLEAPSLGGSFTNRGLLRNDATMSVEAGATLINESLLANNGTLRIDGFLELKGGSGALAQSPSGRLVVNGLVSAAAGLRIDAGTVGGSGVIDGALLLDGNSRVMPGNSPGTLTVTGRVELGPGSELVLEIDGRGAHDRLRAGEFVAAGGTVTLSFVDGVVPDIDQGFELLRVDRGSAYLNVPGGLPPGLYADEYRSGAGSGEGLVLAFRPAEAGRIEGGYFQSWPEVYQGQVLYADSPLDAQSGPLFVNGTLALRRDATWQAAGPVWVGATGRFTSSSAVLQLPGRLQVAGSFVNRGQARVGELQVDAGGRFANEGVLQLGEGGGTVRVDNQGLLRHGGGNGATASLALAAGSTLELRNARGARTEMLASSSVPGFVDNRGSFIVGAAAELTGLSSFLQVEGRLHVDGRLAADTVDVGVGVVSGRGRIDAPMALQQFGSGGEGSPPAVLRPGSEDGREAGVLRLGAPLVMGYGSALEFVVDGDGDAGQLVLEAGGVFGDGSYLTVVLLGDALPVEPLSLTLMSWSGGEAAGLYSRITWASRVVVRDALGDTDWAGGSWSMSIEGDQLHLLLTPVPEPGTYGLMLGGLGLIAWFRRRRAARVEATR